MSHHVLCNLGHAVSACPESARSSYLYEAAKDVVSLYYECPGCVARVRADAIQGELNKLNRAYFANSDKQPKTLNNVRVIEQAATDWVDKNDSNESGAKPYTFAKHAFVAGAKWLWESVGPETTAANLDTFDITKVTKAEVPGTGKTMDELRREDTYESIQDQKDTLLNSGDRTTEQTTGSSEKLCGKVGGAAGQTAKVEYPGGSGEVPGSSPGSSTHSQSKSDTEDAVEAATAYAVGPAPKRQCPACGEETAWPVDKKTFLAGVAWASRTRNAEQGKYCSSCGQLKEGIGQTGEYKCPECGLPRMHDEVATTDTQDCPCVAETQPCYCNRCYSSRVVKESRAEAQVRASVGTPPVASPIATGEESGQSRTTVPAKLHRDDACGEVGSGSSSSQDVFTQAHAWVEKRRPVDEESEGRFVQEVYPEDIRSLMVDSWVAGCRASVARPASAPSIALAQILKDTLHRIVNDTSNGYSAQNTWIAWVRETARNAERLLDDTRVIATARSAEKVGGDEGK